MSDEISRIVGEAIGHRLMKLAASAHLFEGKLDDGPIELWLFFEGMSPLRVFGESDGWRLSGGRRPPFDMDESGEIVVGDVSAKTPFGAAIGAELSGAWLVESSGEAFGVRLDFGLPSRLLILHLDDELLVLEEYPSDAGTEEFIETRVRPVALK